MNKHTKTNAHSRFIRFQTLPGEKVAWWTSNLNIKVVEYLTRTKMFRDSRNWDFSFWKGRRKIHTEKQISFELVNYFTYAQWHFSRSEVSRSIKSTTHSTFSHASRLAPLEHLIENESLLFQITKNPRAGQPILAPRNAPRGTWGPSRFRVPIRIGQSVFAWKRNLTSHLRYQCGQQPRFKCSYCDYLSRQGQDRRTKTHSAQASELWFYVYVIDIFQQWKKI